MNSPRVLQMPKAAQGMRAFMFYIDDWRSSWAVEAMDDHEKVAYLNLLMKAASEPDCGLPDNDLELAVISGLGLRWFKPTRDRNKRIGRIDSEQKIIYKSSGEKLRECFSFRPISEQSLDGRLYNERLHREFIHKEEIRSKNAQNGKHGARRTWGESIDGDRHLSPTSNQSDSMATTMANDPPTYNQQPTTTEEEVPPPPPTNETTKQGGGGGSPPVKPLETNTALTETLSDREYESFCAHCASPPQPLGVPSRALAFRLKQKFKPLPLHHLPKLTDQESPGLWAADTVKPQEMLMEAERQRVMRENPHLARKPTEKEIQRENMLRRARERDVAAGRV